jgi:transcriptional regulator with XRE-family HTH domain
VSDKEAKKLVSTLKRWASSNDKSQYAVAKLLDVDRERVSKWFSGKAVPSLEHGLKIQKFLENPRL